MRTGTKFVGLLIWWAITVITGLIAWLMVNASNPNIQTVWQYLPAIIAAILGPPGIGLGINEVRKAVESGKLLIPKVFGKRDKDEGGV